ncbi:MAG: hypothetical protein LBT39_01080 [Treponema sp.]|jgi:hypothetical protein|nr:hypothetical protein [Treponema sp.]
MATLEQAWSSSARFASGVLDLFTRQREYDQYTLAFEQQAALKKRMDETAAKLNEINPDGTSYFQNPEAYKEYAMGQIEEWRTEALKAGGGSGEYGSGSRFYEDQIRKVEVWGEQSMRPRILQNQVEHGQQQMGVDLQRQTNVILNASDLTPDQKREEVDLKIEEFRRINGFDPEAEERFRQSAYSEIYEQEITMPEGYTGTVAEWEQRVKAAAADVDFLPDTAERARTAIEGGRRQIYSQNYQQMRTANAAYEKHMDQAYGKDGVFNQAEYNKAMEIKRQWAPLRDRAVKGNLKSEYSEESRPSMIGFFRDEADWAPRPKDEDEPGPAGGKAGFMKDLLQRIYNGMDGQTAETDALGNVRSPGIALAAAYTQLNRYAEEEGLNAEVLRNEFDTMILEGTRDALANDFRLDVGAGVMRDIIDIRDSELAAFDPRYKFSDHQGEEERMERELSTVVLNLMAQWENSGHTAADERLFTDSLKKAKNDYIGLQLERHSIMRDLDGSSGSQYRNTGDVSKAAKGYAQVQANSAVATPSRTGGGPYTPESVNDTAASYISVAQGLMEQDLGFGKSEIRVENGKEVTASKNGRDYRITGSDEGKWFLQERLAEGWTTVAVRVSSQEDDRSWYKTSEVGTPLRSGAPRNRGGRLVPAPYQMFSISDPENSPTRPTASAVEYDQIFGSGGVR